MGKKIPNKEWVFKPDIFQSLNFFLLSILLASVSLFVYNLKDDLFNKIMAGLGVVLFSVVALYNFYLLIIRDTTLVVNQRGFSTKSFIKKRENQIPFKDVKNIGKAKQIITTYNRGFKNTVKQNYLVITLKNPEKYTINKNFFGGAIKERLEGDIYIQELLLDRSVDNILEILSAYPIKIKKSLEEIKH